MSDTHHRDAVTHVNVEAEPRYWEDATVGGVEDTDGTLIPDRQGGIWYACIRLADGRVEGWPEGVTARLHYKVCDAGNYWLSRADGQRVAKWKGHYVPTAFLCHGDSGHGDYIVMAIGGDGVIERYRQPHVDEERWEAVASPAA